MQSPGRLILAIGVLLAFVAPVCVVTAQQPSDSNFQRVKNRTAAERELQEASALRKKLTERDLKSTIRLFTASAQHFDIAGAPDKAASAQLEAGDTYLMMSDYPQALNRYRRAIHLAANHSEPLCLALSHAARTYANIGRVRNAAEYSRRAVRLCEGTGNQKALADALESEGEARFWTADKAGAMASLTRARQLFSEVNDRDGEALATMMLAEAINADDHEQASRLLWTALNLWTKNGNEYGVARAHALLALFAIVVGDFSLAQCHCGRALHVFQNVADKDNEAITLNILGRIARDSGDMDVSLGDYRRARDDFAALRDDLGEAESITGMGAALAGQNNYGPLLALYKRKLYLGEKAGNASLVASSLLDVGDVYSHQRRYHEAGEKFSQALAKYRGSGSRYGESNALMRLGILRSQEGNYQGALELLARAGKLKEKNGQVEDLAKVQYARARIYRRLNRLEEARAESEKTINIIESQRLRITAFDSRAQYFASVHAYYSLYIQLLMALHVMLPDQGYMQLAFEASERSKVRSLLDLLANNQQAASCDDLLTRESDPDSAPAIANMRAELPASNVTRSLTLTGIQKEISDGDTLLVEYALGDEKSFAWIVNGHEIIWRELPAATVIRKQASAFREALLPLAVLEQETVSEYIKREHAADRARVLRSRELAKTLLGNLDLPAGSHVLIVPDGPLQYVPFAALPASTRDNDTSLFIAEHDVTMLPSASVLAALRETAARRPPSTAGVAIFADPVFDQIEPSASSRVAVHSFPERSRDLKRALQDTRGSQHIVPLPASRTEAFAIRDIMGPENVQMALGFDANRASVINGSLAHHRVIHFATHGIVDTRHPEMSGLILSLLNPRGEHQDGYLRLGDIYNLKLSADLVVLSSCDSALGKDMESEGVIGLPRGFLYAGARSVIASLWKVDDDATAALMKGLYSRMQQGSSPQAALRESQLELAKDSRYRHPYYWAAFVLEGDYRWQPATGEKH